MLKKIALTTAALAALAGISYGAAGTTTFAAIDTIDGMTNFKPSSNVIVMYKNDAGTAGTPQNYALASKHTSGDTYYVTSNQSTSIYQKKVTTKAGTPINETDIGTVDAGFSINPTGYNPL